MAPLANLPPPNSEAVPPITIATKVSAGILIAPVLLLILTKMKRPSQLGTFILSTFAFSILLSPHNLISFNDFAGSIHYESDVARGLAQVFYTRQFFGTVPIMFQFTKIFPYALGWPVLLLFVLGFILLPLKREYNLLRLAFLIYFLPTTFLYAKWTRFMAPVMLLMVIIAVLFLEFLIFNFHSKFQISNIIKWILFLVILLISITPGIAYLSIYTHLDVRFTASEWIYKNIPDNSTILSETANVVDLPIPVPNRSNNETLKQFNNYQYISFNFYDLDQDEKLQQELKEHLATIGLAWQASE